MTALTNASSQMSVVAVRVPDPLALVLWLLNLTSAGRGIAEPRSARQTSAASSEARTQVTRMAAPCA
jgi:hypothetical protein